MPIQRRGEFTCDWCGDISRYPAARVYGRGWLGPSLQWQLCEPCWDMLFDLRGKQSFVDLVVWRGQHGY